MGDPHKLYELTLEPRDGYLRAFVRGNLAAPETRVEAWTEIIAHCRAGTWKKLLVVQISPGNSTPTDAFVSSRGIAAIGLDGIKIAFADLDPANFENNQFGETVAANRGVNARVFTNEDEALEWLIGASK